MPPTVAEMARGISNPVLSSYLSTHSASFAEAPFSVLLRSAGQGVQ